ncbi:MAG: glucose-1-phosphate adenylyltransferase subunit GlgD, partial [Aristaeellaceae bacterium]
MKIYGYEFTGYQRRVETGKGYYKLNMDMLDYSTRKELLNSNPVYTKVRDEMPARYGENVNVVNSLVADGCIIEGTVENSILARGVRVAPGAHVKNCIVMQDGQIHSGAYIENCILDKQAVIKRNAKLIGPAAYPIVIAKNVVI